MARQTGMRFVVAMIAWGIIAGDACAQGRWIELAFGNWQNERHEEHFNEWLYQGSQSEEEVRRQQHALLLVYVKDVERVCQLSEVQRRKLLLAGRGDILEYFDAVAELRTEFVRRHEEQAFMNQLWQQMQPLQQRLQAGLFGEGSLYHKTLWNALDPVQRKQYGQVDAERRAFRYRACVELLIANLEVTLPLRDRQREGLIDVILAETRPPARFDRQTDQRYVGWALSQIPTARVRPLFSEAEWEMLLPLMKRQQNMGQWLRQQGVLPDAETEEARGAIPGGDGPHAYD